MTSTSSSAPEVRCGVRRRADVKAWLTHVVSEEGQQASAELAGSAPISDATRKKANAALEAISAQ